METKPAKYYKVRRIESKDSSFAVTEIRDFTYPWEGNKPASISFNAVYDGQWLRCCFQVEDKNVNVYVDKNAKEEVIYGDRVEIFFSTDQTLDSYYCLEIDPLGRVYDYRASHYRKFDSHWSWPTGHLIVEAKKEATGYKVECSISIQSLNDLGLLKEGTLMCGLYRGKCVKTGIPEPIMQWISWVKPDSKTPDFHIPSSFGVFSLE